MTERKEQPPYRSHKVIIRGTVEGYDVASLEDLKKVADQIESLQGDITTLKGQLGDLQKALNATNLRLERLEGFLKSFK